MKYLGAYVHRVAISKSRIVSFTDNSVTFLTRNKKLKSRSPVTLPLDVFCRRFLKHLIPRALKRIRHFGFLSNPRRAEALKLCRKFLPSQPQAEAQSPITPAKQTCCRKCNSTNLLLLNIPRSLFRAFQTNHIAQLIPTFWPISRLPNHCSGPPIPSPA
jgi:hypothetical protein